jgi:hypothetical protein
MEVILARWTWFIFPSHRPFLLLTLGKHPSSSMGGSSNSPVTVLTLMLQGFPVYLLANYSGRD